MLDSCFEIIQTSSRKRHEDLFLFFLLYLNNSIESDKIYDICYLKIFKIFKSYPSCCIHDIFNFNDNNHRELIYNL